MCDDFLAPVANTRLNPTVDATRPDTGQHNNGFCLVPAGRICCRRRSRIEKGEKNDWIDDWKRTTSSDDGFPHRDIPRLLRNTPTAGSWSIPRWLSPLFPSSFPSSFLPTPFFLLPSLSFLSIILALLALVILLCFPSQTPSYPPVVFIPSFVYPPTRSFPYLTNPSCVRLLSLMPTTPTYQQPRIQPGTLDYCWVKKHRLTATPLPDGSFTRG